MVVVSLSSTEHLDDEYITATFMSRVVDIGARTGSWASELRCRGVSVAAYDIAPVHLDLHNGYHHLGDGGNALPWFDVQAGGADVVVVGLPNVGAGGRGQRRYEERESERRRPRF